MRLLLPFLILVPSVWAQTAPAPTVRDAFARSQPEEAPPKNGPLKARLRRYLDIVICQAEYSVWVSANSATNLALFIDGQRATPPSVPVLAADDRTGDQPKTIRHSCAIAEAKIAADKVAADQASKTPDPNQLAADQKDADAKAAAAKDPNAASPTTVLEFFLDPQFLQNNDTKATWLQLLQRPWEQANIRVSAGPAAGPPWPVALDAPLVGFDRLNIWWALGWAALFVVAVGSFVKSAKTTDIIRDTGSLPPGTPPGTMKSFSLGRTQMAIWTFLVAGALVFIFMATWNENTITPGVLVLIGISAGTTLLAAVAEGAPAPQPTKGFFNDLLSDGTGMSFHRYQMLLFTIILGVFFAIKVGNGLVMPEFDMTLLGLMGISNGTYLGFKLQGK